MKSKNEKVDYQSVKSFFKQDFQKGPKLFWVLFLLVTHAIFLFADCRCV